MIPGERRKKTVFATLVVGLIGLGYIVYKQLSTVKEEEKVYTKKSTVIVLSNSIIAANLPLEEILNKSTNITFILSPWIDIDELSASSYSKLVKNYKFLKCSNLQGLWAICKSLRPELLFICNDDLKIEDVPDELNRYIGEIVNLDQNSDSIYEETVPYLVYQ